MSVEAELGHMLSLFYIHICGGRGVLCSAGSLILFVFVIYAGSSRVLDSCPFYFLYSFMEIIIIKVIHSVAILL